MECKFFVGQKVVFTWKGPRPVFGKALKAGKVYIIRGINPDFNEPVLYLRGIHNPAHPTLGAEWGYEHWGFRPAYDIQQFRDIAEKARKTGRVTVDA